jgi:hypothetical protein
VAGCSVPTWVTDCCTRTLLNEEGTYVDTGLSYVTLRKGCFSRGRAVLLLGPSRYALPHNVGRAPHFRSFFRMSIECCCAGSEDVSSFLDASCRSVKDVECLLFWSVLCVS